MYKRQIEECEKENAGTEITLYIKEDTENEDYTKYLEPVSYTHLDVYKRQVFFSILLFAQYG